MLLLVIAFLCSWLELMSSYSTCSYDKGSVYDADLLDITSDDVSKMVGDVLSDIASLSLQLNFPTLPACPTLVTNAAKNLLAIAIATDYSFPLADKMKDAISNPVAVVVPVAAAAAAAPAASEPAKKAAEPEPEEDEDMGFSLFD